jgi:hypothetical protein
MRPASQLLIHTRSLILLLQLLLAPDVPAHIVTAKPLTLAGVWLYQGRTSLEGRDYAVVFRYTIFQRGRRICGSIEHSGAPNRTIEQYSFKGIVHDNYADVWIDAGTPSDADYFPKYPFQPTEIGRLRVSANQLMMGSIFREQPSNLVFPIRDSAVIYLKELRLSRIATATSSEDIFPQDPMVAKAFVARCLHDSGYATMTSATGRYWPVTATIGFPN